MSQPWNSDQYDATLARDPSRKRLVSKRPPFLLHTISAAKYPPMVPYCVNKEFFGVIPGKLDGGYVSLLGSAHHTDEPLQLGVDLPGGFTSEPVFFILLIDTRNVMALHAGQEAGGLLSDSIHKVVIGSVHLGENYVVQHLSGITTRESKKPLGQRIPHPGGFPVPIPPDDESQTEPSVWYSMCGHLEYVVVEHTSNNPDLDPMIFKYVRYAIGQNDESV
jgi:hypothetical protein